MGYFGPDYELRKQYIINNTMISQAVMLFMIYNYVYTMAYIRTLLIL